MTTQRAEWSDLENKGFIVIPGFLSPDEIEVLANEFFQTPWLDRHRYVFKYTSKALLDRFGPKVMALAERGRGRPSLLLNGFYFATKTEVNGKRQDQVFSYHQDRESYYLWQTHEGYLNFYIPLIKPDRERSNLTVLPFDRIKLRSPEAHAKLVGKGAHMLEESDEGTDIVDESMDGGNLRLGFSAHEIAETPLLSPGDLLLLRGDVVHKTQDADTDRVAISFRTIDADLQISRSKLADGGTTKYMSMIKNRTAYQSVIDAFDAAGKTDMTSGEFWPIYERILREAAGKPAVAIRRFLSSLTRDERSAGATSAPR
jgi:hypothetical protein